MLPSSHFQRLLLVHKRNQGNHLFLISRLSVFLHGSVIGKPNQNFYSYLLILFVNQHLNPQKLNAFTYSIIPSTIIIITNMMLIREFRKLKMKISSWRLSTAPRNEIRSTVAHGLFISISFVIISYTRSVAILVIDISPNLDPITEYYYVAKIESIANLYYIFIFFIIFYKNKPFANELKRLTCSWLICLKIKRK